MSYVTSREQFAREEGFALGIERGMRQGLEPGRQQGEARALLRLLEARLGAPLPAVVARVQSAPTPLEVWLTRTLTAERIEQVFGEP